SASGPDRPSGPPECAPARTAAAASSSSSPCLLLIDNDAELATLSSSAEEWGLWSGYDRPFRVGGLRARLQIQRCESLVSALACCQARPLLQGEGHWTPTHRSAPAYSYSNKQERQGRNRRKCMTPHSAGNSCAPHFVG